jgi:hypothetical protein
LETDVANQEEIPPLASPTDPVRHVPDVPLEPPFGLIRDGLKKGRVIPFIGSGASLVGRPPGKEWNCPECNFLPKASELADYLDRRSGFPSIETPELSRVAQYFDGVAGRGGLDDELHDVFAKGYQPSPLHYYLADFDHLLIVTTNYDDLLEKAFREKGREFYVVVYKTGQPTFLVWKDNNSEPKEALANELDLPVGQIPIIYKMHGTADPSDPDRDSYVITEDDYVEFLARMASMTAIPAVFARPFQRSHFLFLGYGLKDWNLRVILYKIWKDWARRRYASWAIQHQAQPLERVFWSRRDLTIYEMSIDDLLKKLQA